MVSTAVLRRTIDAYDDMTRAMTLANGSSDCVDDALGLRERERDEEGFVGDVKKRLGDSPAIVKVEVDKRGEACFLHEAFNGEASVRRYVEKGKRRHKGRGCQERKEVREDETWELHSRSSIAVSRKGL
ncbi:hypothetical protein MMC06_002837 [Schaereria dolodes]|nr:hypothetical protein [Schaereria dolodes]